MKILAICSSLDLRYPFSCTPAWWQLFKGLYEIGVEVVATPYQGYAVEGLWWKVYGNPCQWEGELFRRARNLVRRTPGGLKDTCQPEQTGESLSDKMVRKLANAFIRPRWQRHICQILEVERDIDAILVLTVPLNHLAGLPRCVKTRYSLPVIYYDGDMPESLPAFQGFASGFKIYQGADLAEYDGFICNSEGGAIELGKMGAGSVHVLHYGADPDLFHPVDVEQDIDVFFYGHGCEYRREWIEQMIAIPSCQMNGARFAVRGTAMDVDLGRAQQLPYASFSKLREYCCRSKINLNITRRAHASVYASSSSRPFELAALGCCIVSNPVEGMEEWFEPGHEVFIVHDAQEAVRTYGRLLADEGKRQAAGQRARGRVLREHTYRRRARQLVEIIRSIGG